MRKKKVRIMLIVLIAMLSVVLCLLMGMCLFYENSDHKNSKKESAVEQEAGKTEETELPEVPGRPTEERVEKDIVDINIPETTVSDRESDSDYQISDDYETSRDFVGNEDYENGSGNTTREDETVGDYESNIGNKPGESNETDKENEIGRD